MLAWNSGNTVDHLKELDDRRTLQLEKQQQDKMNALKKNYKEKMACENCNKLLIKEDLYTFYGSGKYYIGDFYLCRCTQCGTGYLRSSKNV